MYTVICIYRSPEKNKLNLAIFLSASAKEINFVEREKTHTRDIQKYDLRGHCDFI